MPAATNIESIFNNLNSYHAQLSSLSQALNALRDVSDHIVAALEKDRAAIAEYITAQNDGRHTQANIKTEVEDIFASATHVVRAADTQEASLAQLIARDASPSETAPQIDTVPHLDVVIAPVAEATTIALDIARPCDQTVAQIGPADATQHAAEALLLDTATDTAATAAETDPALTLTPTGETADTSAADAAIATGDGKVVDLANHRKARAASPARWRAKALVASLAITATATLGMHEIMQTELGQRLIELGTCDGDMLSANRDCALLAWLML